MLLAAGVDIGGSHISSAIVEIEKNEIIPHTYYRGKVNNKASKEIILQTWAEVINKSIARIGIENLSGLGVAVPGPFDYKKGIGMYEINDKYEALYKVNVFKGLTKYIDGPDIPLHFLNDASGFGIGSSVFYPNKKILALTLGTGFGASFLKGQIPLVEAENVPENGCLWDKGFRDGIADDYFSTRWFLSRYSSITGGLKIEGVRELVALNNEYTFKIFDEFAQNLSEFLTPYLKRFNPDVLILGGNIAKSSHLFLTKIQQHFIQNKCTTNVEIKTETEKSIILGAALLFDPKVSTKILRQLPKV